MIHRYKSFSSAETKRLGATFARAIVHKPRRGALVVALRGELGSGKTTFTQGFLTGLSIRRRSASPTFILVRRIPLKKGRFRDLFHIDAYRLHRPRDLRVGSFQDLFLDPRHIVLIEWADRIRRAIPKHAYWLVFHHGKHERERTITLPNTLR